MKEIPLTQGMTAIVDDEDYERLMQWKWYYHKPPISKTGYAVRKKSRAGGKQGTTIRMHRVILDTPPGFDTDHINSNGLDNRKENLRVATTAQNQWNKRKPKNNTSGVKGVCWQKDKKKWQARIEVNKKSIFLGRFQDKIEAARAYNAAAVKYYGDFAHLNKVDG